MHWIFLLWLDVSYASSQEEFRLHLKQDLKGRSLNFPDKNLSAERPRILKNINFAMPRMIFNEISLGVATLSLDYLEAIHKIEIQ